MTRRAAGTATRTEVVAVLGEWVARPGPLHRRLSDALRAAIARDELRAGDRLPAERDLARLLSLSRSTVVAAYDRLRDDGLVTSRRGSGTYVPRRVDDLAEEGDRPASVVQSAVMSGLGDPGDDIIELTVAAPSARAVLTEETLRDAVGDVRALVGTHGYVPLGLPALRDAVAAHLAHAGLPTRRSQVLITSGAQQGISLAIGLLVRPGDWALIENPTWSGAMDALRSAGANLIPVPLDEQGARADVIQGALRRVQPRIAYLCPMFQNPTGRLMGEARRRELVRLAGKAGLAIIDDNALADVSYGADPPPPLAAFATAHAGAGEILTVGSLGKLVWGGLRVGWVRASETTIDRLARLKVVADHGGSLVSQAIAIRLLERVDEVRAVRRVEGIERLELLRTLLADRLPDWSCNRPEGGHVAWVRLPRGDANEFSQAALRHGVAVVSGSLASPDGTMTDHLRIPFVAEPATLVEGVRRLAAAWTSYAASLHAREPVRIVV